MKDRELDCLRDWLVQRDSDSYSAVKTGKVKCMYKIIKVNIMSGLIVEIIRGYDDFRSATAAAEKLESGDDLHFYHVRSEQE